MSARDMFFPEGTKFSEAEERAFARDDLVYTVTETLLMAMEDNNISKVDLARKLNKSKSHISRLLDGSRNMTLGSLSDICFAIGIKPEIHIPVELPEKPVKEWSSLDLKLRDTSKAVYKKTGNLVRDEKSSWSKLKVA